MKVSKETMLAMLVAVESFLARDHEADWREWERRVNAIAERVGAIAGVRTEMFAPPLHYHVPHLRIQWDEQVVPVKSAEAKQRLREEPVHRTPLQPKQSLRTGSVDASPGRGGDCRESHSRDLGRHGLTRRGRGHVLHGRTCGAAAC